MPCHVGRALDEIILLQIVQQQIVESMRGFCFASEFGKLIAVQDTLTLVNEKVWRGGN